MSDWGARVQQAWETPSAIGVLLAPLAWIYSGLLRCRHGFRRLGWPRTERLPVPVVVVGNLVVGGAGKTPTVLAIVDLMVREGMRPGIVSRGHGREGEEIVHVEPGTPARTSGDEPLLLRRRSGVPVVVARDRVAAARALLARHPGIDVIVADDGLQHHRLGRDVEVIVFDERGTGNGKLLPAGPLRERMGARPPPSSLVLYNADRPSTPWPGAIAIRRFGGLVELAGWWRQEPPSKVALALLQGRPVVAACGLARPQRFFSMLLSVGLDVEPLALPDHFDFANLPWPPTTADVVVTEKDAVKLDPARLGRTRVWVAALDFALPTAFADALLRLLDRPSRNPHENAPA